MEWWSVGVVGTVARARFSRAARAHLLRNDSNAAVRRFDRWLVRVHGSSTLYSKDGKMHSNNKVNSVLPLTHPVLAEGTKARQRLAILLPIRGGLVRDDVVDVTDRKP